MSLDRDVDLQAVWSSLKFDQSNAIIVHELRANRSRDQVGKALSAQLEHIVDLDVPKPVFRRFNLDGNDVVRAAPVDANIQLVDLYLPLPGQARSEMVLHRKAAQSGEDVDQAVVSDDR